MRMPGLRLSNKLLRYAIILFFILTLNFLLPRLMPGDPVVFLLGEDVLYVRQEVMDALMGKYGLDRPILDQYLAYLVSVARLDLGFSISKNVPVATLIAERLYWTLMIAIPSIIVSATVAMAMGLYAGARQGGTPDRALVTISMVLHTLPGFFLAMLFIIIFSYRLRIFPLGRATSGDATGLPYALDVLHHLFLPVCVLSLMGANTKFLVLRNATIQAMGEYYIFVARARGLAERAVVYGHVARNILPQLISIVALNAGFMVSGAMLVEIVFSLNGMGTLIYDATNARDYPLLQGCFLVITVCVLAANLLADVLYGIADPRVGDAGHAGAG